MREYFKKEEVVHPPPVLAEESKRPRSSKPTSKHDLVTHFVEESNCEVSNWTKIIRAHCQNQLLVRINLGFEEVIPADQRILSEGHESKLQHQYAVAVQELYTNIQSDPARTKNAAETTVFLRRFLPPGKNPKSRPHRQFS